ncbi:acetyl-CoA carboxylase biotin carboxylase subunit [Oribacterium sinus]|uniref:biotin carboxylase n=1 Tax=Oribacterium sinus F0268 TaxID=585501 RepID=C2KVB3_9FIRM|nr:acetyl-CoA carboxylase biotin carboxylase subunit [Oribacterium sinus]EEJ52297.1 acetyl-CoA carboxylase, biotin carboxylase subunit [Oribacterium sinus F0268]
MFKRVLVANRGEIAVRVIRALRGMGIPSVAVYSKEDQDSLHGRLAEERVCIGEGSSRNSYLNMDTLITVAKNTGCDAIHPGYGFLSENAQFAEKCRENDICFIGPSPEVIDGMGNKSQARAKMREAGVPVVPGSLKALYDVKEALEEAKAMGFPVMIKASSGGGGKGMRECYSEGDFENEFLTAQRESANAFSDDAMYLEKLILEPRHVEVQIMGDSFGNVIALGERDCSIQRNHQKLVEESPSPIVTAESRKAMMEAAVNAAKAVSYVGAGTIEFIVDQEGKFYFMEMNTRIQVEHGVTELVTDTDLVIEQIRVCAGEPLSMKQEEVLLRGHAIECRINAEIPEKNFMPSPGTITALHLPGGNGVRVDTAIYTGYKIPMEYDSMIAKVLVHGKDRQEAIRKMKGALEEMLVLGVETNLDFQYKIMQSESFVEGKVDTGFIERFTLGGK